MQQRFLVMLTVYLMCAVLAVADEMLGFVNNIVLFVLKLLAFVHLSIMLAEQLHVLFSGDFGLCSEDVCVNMCGKHRVNFGAFEIRCVSKSNVWPQVHVVCRNVQSKCRCSLCQRC